MKIQVVTKDDSLIEGYERVEISNGDVVLENYSDYECSLILAPDCLDHFSFNGMQSFILKARQKMRMGSKLVIGGTDIRLLSRMIVDGSISVEEANEMLFSKGCCADLTTVTNIVNHIGLNIITAKLSGIHYEIEATR